MKHQKTILAINGSASQNSSNSIVINEVKENCRDEYNFIIFDRLTELPPFQTALTDNNVPEKVIEFRELIKRADGLLICTPEYVFSIPSGLKNAIEWCVSTTVFSQKKTGLITAAANGRKGHEELLLIMETLEAKFTAETTMLLPGIKGKIEQDGQLDQLTKTELKSFTNAYLKLVNNEL